MILFYWDDSDGINTLMRTHCSFKSENIKCLKSTQEPKKEKTKKKLPYSHAAVFWQLRILYPKGKICSRVYWSAVFQLQPNNKLLFAFFAIRILKRHTLQVEPFDERHFNSKQLFLDYLAALMTKKNGLLFFTQQIQSAKLKAQ